MITVAERFQRCGRVWNGAEESPSMPTCPDRCFRVWNGGREPGWRFRAYNTVTESGILPQTVRHRYRHDNFKFLVVCLTQIGGRWLQIRRAGGTPALKLFLRKLCSDGYAASSVRGTISKTGAFRSIISRVTRISLTFFSDGR